MSLTDTLRRVRGVSRLTEHAPGSTIVPMDDLSRFMDDVGRLADPEILRIASVARRHQNDRSIAKAREAARAVVLRADGAAEFNKHSDALRRWGAYNNAVGEGAVDDSMPPRVQAFPVLVDALLAEVAGAELDEGSRRQLLATWVATRPDRLVRRTVPRTESTKAE